MVYYIRSFTVFTSIMAFLCNVGILHVKTKTSR